MPCINHLETHKMNLTIQLTAEDYIQATYVHMRPRPVLKWAGYFILLLAVITLVVSLYFAIVDHEGFSLPILMIACLAYLAFLFFVFQPRRIQKIFRQQKSLHSPYSFAPMDEAVIIKSDIAEGKMPWDHFVKWKEGKNLFMVYQSDVLFHMVPKRCFASPEEMTQFRKLLEAKLGPAAV